MHRLQDLEVSVYHHRYGATPVDGITLNVAYQALISIGIHEHLQVHQVSQLLVHQRHDAFDDHNRFGVNVNSFRFTVAFDITIGGLLYRLASTQISELLVQKLPIECRRVVEVDLMTFFLGHLRGIVII